MLLPDPYDGVRAALDELEDCGEFEDKKDNAIYPDEVVPEKLPDAATDFKAYVSALWQRGYMVSTDDANWPMDAMDKLGAIVAGIMSGCKFLDGVQRWEKGCDRPDFARTPIAVALTAIAMLSEHECALAANYLADFEATREFDMLLFAGTSPGVATKFLSERATPEERADAYEFAQECLARTAAHRAFVAKIRDWDEAAELSPPPPWPALDRWDGDDDDDDDDDPRRPETPEPTPGSCVTTDKATV